MARGRHPGWGHTLDRGARLCQPSAMQRIIVTGAGVIGAAIAFRLAQGGARVTVVEATAPAAQASGKSFGWINASFFADAHHFALRHAAIEAHRRLEADLGPTGAEWPGCLWWDRDGAAFDAQAETLTALGYPLREVSRAEFARLEPAVADPPDRSLLFPAEGAVDLADLTGRLLAAAVRHGAQVICGCPCLGFVTTAGRVTGLRLPQGDLPADQVVLATGTATEALLAGLDIRLPMLPRPGLLLRTQAVPRVLTHILASPEIEIRQDAAGHIHAPAAAAHQADSTPRLAERPDLLADAGLARLRALLPGPDLRWDRATLAWRPVPGDGLPAVGPAGIAGLYVATLHSGATLAPLIGQLVAQEMLEGRPAPLLAPYRPARFA